MGHACNRMGMHHEGNCFKASNLKTSLGRVPGPTITTSAGWVLASARAKQRKIVGYMARAAVGGVSARCATEAHASCKHCPDNCRCCLLGHLWAQGWVTRLKERCSHVQQRHVGTWRKLSCWWHLHGFFQGPAFFNMRRESLTLELYPSVCFFFLSLSLF